ncbi:unnamed protein product [Psylliodes chrysocephalus]|uniref:PSI domain-containing protein n=1 Tax=Psylliodes chrysocephalus TaxID=3402493 RepID=A0A9P0DAL8_9CUCU|nr:unnamed protein product [Psylliodes chrysocephala]
MDGHRCTHDTAENCRNDILVTGVSRTIPSYRSGPGFCPRINATVGISPEILVASGTKKAIKVKVHIIGQFIVQTRFVCQFNIEGRITSVNAQLLGDTIYCDVMEFFYTSGASNITVPFAVIWGGSKPLDNPDNVHIVIYRCRKMADSCGNCLALAKKYNCGWCQSSDRCEVKDQCENRSDVWLNWSQSCPNPEDTSFSLESNNLNINLNLVNDNLSIKNTTKNDSGVNCTTPSIDSLPSIPPVQNHVFDCNTYSSCTQCVSSSFPCDWCVDRHRCTHDTAENCRNDILVTGVSRTIPSYRSGPGFCPRINARIGISPKILIASGTKKAIKVKVHIIGQFIVQTRFVCQFNIEGKITSVNAQLLGDTIYCDAMEFFYTSRAPNITVPFAVIWGGSKPLDNPDNVHIVIYRCRKMADNCGNCLALANKYNCGWCQSSDRCEVKNQCENGSGVWLNWNQTCPNPEDTSFSAELNSDNLNINLNLVNDNLSITNATENDSGVNCTTPKTDSLSSIPPVQNHVFDCNTYSSCTQCVSSSFPCDWCIDGHRCTHDTAENCRNDILVTGVSKTIPSYRSGPGFCPRINATVGISPEILVASGTKKAIKVKVHIIGQFIVQTRFVCQFNIEGRITSVNAQLLGDTIYCDVIEFSYTSNTPNITVPFAVIWGGSKPLDNPDNIHIVIYRCHKMADNCGNCLVLANKYNCGWCQSSDRCEVKDQCENGSGIWLNWNQTCSNPKDTSFSPEVKSDNLNINLNLVNDNL